MSTGLSRRRGSTLAALALLGVTLGALLMPAVRAQQQPGPLPPAMPRKALPAGPLVIDSAEGGQVRVTVMKGLENPWSLAFLPTGEMLITERPGRLRIVRNGVLDPTPIAGIPKVFTEGLGGLMDIQLHPRFSENRFVYLSYTRLAPGGRTAALLRGRLEGMALVDVKELFVSNGVGMGPAPGAGMTFGRDGNLYMAVGGANDEIAQDPKSHTGKILRFRDDGSVPPDNPFVGRAGGAQPEIYSIGHRNMLGLTVHPATGAVWQNENGPLGGDEVNILKAGGNYGWPIVSYGRQYSGARIPNASTQTFEEPVLVWTPSIAISGMTFYTGDRFPAWKGNLFVGGLQFGRIPGTGQMHRIVFNEKGEEIRREAFFVDLRQRIRNVKQGPDGLLYVLTDETDGALLKLEPAR